MPISDQMWMLDKSETFALSSWLTEAETIRKEINRLVLSNWAQVESERILSVSILRRYIGYWNSYREFTDRKAMGTHGGGYAEELVASIVRSILKSKFGDKFHVLQNHWIREVQMEADISVWENSGRDLRICAILEVKSVLDVPQWKSVINQRGRYSAWQPGLPFWLIAFRQAGLSESVKEEIDHIDWACVLWKRNIPGLALEQTDIENQIEIWKPIETLLDRVMTRLT